MGGDELGDCGDSVFFFLGSGDNDVGIWGVCSSFTSKFELGVWGFVFFCGSVNRSPLASVLGSFFVKYAKSVSGWCRSFDYEFVFLRMSTPPLQVLEVEVYCDQNRRIVCVCNVVSCSKGAVFAPVCIFKVSLGDVAFSPSVQMV